MYQPDSSTLHAVRRFSELISDRYAPEGLVLFGSRARGEHGQTSDADVAVILPGSRLRAVPITLEMADIAYDVLLETGINISPLPIWHDEWAHPELAVNPSLLGNIHREGIRV